MQGQSGTFCSRQLRAESLSFSVGTNQILSNVSIEVETGEIVGLLGRDGAGKTSLYELLAGLSAPDAGRIFLNGIDVTAQTEEERARLGLSYLPEEPSIFEGLTAEENIQLALDVIEPNAEARPSRLEQLLNNFQLVDVRNQPATSLSGGERRRCEVARSMALNPAILMLDEPFRGLDPMSVREVSKAIAKLKSEHVGVLISDYDLHDLIGLIDRAFVLHEGRVIFGGSAEELLGDQAVRAFYLGKSFVL